jgi:hypothetical protein
MNRKNQAGCLSALCAALAAGCGAGSETGEDVGHYTSASGTLQEAEFDGELLMESWADPASAIRTQMLFTIGVFNGEGGVSRLDKYEITNLAVEAAGGLKRVRYHAKIPVSIRKTKPLPSTYVLVLPRRADHEGQAKFFEKYAETCVDPWAHDNEVGIQWYYYRPRVSGCSLADEDVVRAQATVRKSPENTRGKYPEYDRIWEDGALRLVAIYGKVEDGTTTDADRGIWSYNHFVATMRKELPNVTTTPAVVPEDPGVAVPEITVDATLPDGKRISITSFLVDNVREGGPAFEARYNELSTEADIIVYNGHAGLGQNVRKLATMGKFRAGKYQIFYMNGCDTFAYVDGSLAETRALLNPDDPTGTKYMEILTNSMPPTWDSLPINTIALVRALRKHETPLDYEKLLGTFDQSGIVTVTGEEDNTFRP